MAQTYSVEIAQTAVADLDSIIDYWEKNGDAVIGCKLALDLAKAAAELTHDHIAENGKKAADQFKEEVKEVYVMQNSYKVIYMIFGRNSANPKVKILALRKV